MSIYCKCGYNSPKIQRKDKNALLLKRKKNKKIKI